MRNYKVLEDGKLFVAEVKKDGKTLYCVMELLDDTNFDYWKAFEQFTQSYNRSAPFSIKKAEKSLKNENEEEVASHIADLHVRNPENVRRLIEVPAFDPEDNPNCSRATEAIRAIGGGIAGFSWLLKKGNYISYISTKPVTCRKTNEEAFKEEGEGFMQRYQETFDHLEICVCTRVNCSPEHYENRGIFRTPSSILNGGHKGLSTMIHAFTAVIAGEQFGKKYLFVNALPIMSQIMQKFLQDKPDAVKPLPKTEQLRKGLTIPYFVGGGDLPTEIRVDALVERMEEVVPGSVGQAVDGDRGEVSADVRGYISNPNDVKDESLHRNRLLDAVGPKKMPDDKQAQTAVPEVKEQPANISFAAKVWKAICDFCSKIVNAVKGAFGRG